MKSISYVIEIKKNEHNFHVANLKLAEKSNCLGR